MKVRLAVSLINLNEDYEVAPPKADAPLVKLLTAMASVLEGHPSLNNLAPLIGPADFPELEFPSVDAEMTIEVVLCNEPEDLSIILDRGMGEAVGVFANSSGAFDETRWAADKFRVLVVCGDEFYKRHVKAERALEQDPWKSQYDLDYLKGAVTTLTHEVMHAIEFINHGGGLSPEQVDNAHDEDYFPFSLRDVCSGRGIRTDMPIELSREDADEFMEQRVEHLGRELTDWAIDRVSPALVQRCIKAYAPRAPEPSSELYSPGL